MDGIMILDIDRYGTIYYHMIQYTQLTLDTLEYQFPNRQFDATSAVSGRCHP